MLPPLTTKRLMVRAPSTGDFTELFGIIWSDPAVMRFVADGRTRTHDQAQSSFTKMLSRYQLKSRRIIKRTVRAI